MQRRVEVFFGFSLFGAQGFSQGSDRSRGSHAIAPHPSIRLEFFRDPIVMDQLKGGVKEDFQIRKQRMVPNIKDLKRKLGRTDQLLIGFLRVAAAFEYGCFIGIPN